MKKNCRCAAHRFVAPDQPSPWAAQFHLPYAHDQMALWALLKDHRPAGGPPLLVAATKPPRP